MSLVESTRSSGTISRAPRPSSLADVLDLILDKGLVIDAYVRISLAGIELLTIDARVVVASVDTYLRFAEAVNRLDLGQTEERGIDALTGRNQGEDEGDSGSQNGSGQRQQNAQDGSGSGQRRQPALARSSRESSKKQSGGGGQSDEEEQSGEDEQEQGLLGRLADRAKFDR
jgi:hypothetical protein